jgi:hypothetical protein
MDNKCLFGTRLEGRRVINENNLLERHGSILKNAASSYYRKQVHIVACSLILFNKRVDMFTECYILYAYRVVIYYKNVCGPHKTHLRAAGWELLF